MPLSFRRTLVCLGMLPLLPVITASASAQDAAVITGRVTGEGNTDFQSAMGKAPAGVARLSRAANIPVICLSGGLGKGAEDLQVDALASILPGPMPLEEAMQRAAELTESGAARVCRLLRAVALLHSRNAAWSE